MVGILIVVVGGVNRVAVERPGFADTKVAVDCGSPVAANADLRSSAWQRHCSALALAQEQALVELESEAGCV